MAEQAERAAEVYDRVEVGDATAIVNELDGPFDTILCYDVLEHLVDPVAVMRRLRELAAPGAHLQVSIPNARYIALTFDLLFRGTFGYTEFGHRDNTHLRWFTRKDMLQALTETGWPPVSDRPAYTRFSTIRRPLDALTRGTVSELISLQWYYLARAA
jgi:2-polyprenyl-3-methyl-5-hydroxy-6-metoxy-1,4-benzoquinol methylase